MGTPTKRVSRNTTCIPRIGIPRSRRIPKRIKKDPEHTRNTDATMDRSAFWVFSPPEMCFARFRKIWSDPNLETQRPERTTEESSDPEKNRVAAVTEKTDFV